MTSLLAFLTTTTTFAQSKVSLSAAKQLEGVDMVIDGKADEAAWTDAQPTSEFVVRTPNPGSKSLQNTAVRVVYDDQALYVFASLLDTEPVTLPICNRDALNHSDSYGKS